MPHTVKILSLKQVTHDVKRFRFQKPGGYRFIPGQATDVSINKPGWENEKHPFTFTCLTDDPELEFTIKIYPEHKGVTNELNQLKEGDELIIEDPWGAIEYKGPGYFIAGGAGITPFIAIFRQLHKENKLADNRLFFSNKTKNDIILEDELTSMLGNNALHVITDEPGDGYFHGFINEEFIKAHVDDFSKHFYTCGPPKMIEAITAILLRNGASPDTVIFEK